MSPTGWRTSTVFGWYVEQLDAATYGVFSPAGLLVARTGTWYRAALWALAQH